MLYVVTECGGDNVVGPSTSPEEDEVQYLPRLQHTVCADCYNQSS